MMNLGLALSGGGSRAMAFHRGTLRALVDLQLVDAVDIVSTVSGGSVFGAAWMCAIVENRSAAQFLADLVPILRRGFLAPALLSPRALQLLLPWRTRTHRLAETFDELLTNGRPLSDLPARPLLCLNSTVLNNASVGRFSRGGFSASEVGPRDPRTNGYPETKVEVTVGFATAASAAFPFGLPPLPLDTRDLPPLQGSLQGHRRLYLTDGGVLENLGAQTLLRSGRFGTKNLIVSDAGTASRSWQPTLLGRLLNFGAFALTADTLSQLITVMNDKQNKSMRQLVVREVGEIEPRHEHRGLWFVRIDQTMDSFLEGIPSTRLAALAREKGIAEPARDARAIERFLDAAGARFAEVRAMYDTMGGDEAVGRANAVETQFTKLSEDAIGVLEKHAYWQMHACRAVYGPVVDSSRDARRTGSEDTVQP